MDTDLFPEQIDLGRVPNFPIGSMELVYLSTHKCLFLFNGIHSGNIFNRPMDPVGLKKYYRYLSLFIFHISYIYIYLAILRFRALFGMVSLRDPFNGCW